MSQIQIEEQIIEVSIDEQEIHVTVPQSMSIDVKEAPKDGKEYVRKNGEWVEHVAGGVGLTKIYVDTHIGDDNGDGSESKPFLTLQPAFDLRVSDSHKDYAASIIVTGRNGNSIIGDFNVVLTDILYATSVVAPYGGTGEDGFLMEINHCEITDAEKGLTFKGISVDQITLHQTFANTNQIIFDSVRNGSIEFYAGNIADPDRIKIAIENSCTRLNIAESGAFDRMADWNIFLNNSILELRDSSATSYIFNKIEAREATIINRYDVPILINFSESEAINPVESLKVVTAGDLTISSSNLKPLAIELFMFGDGKVTWGGNTANKLVIGGVETPFKYATLTQSEYDLLTPDPDTFYFITE